MFAVSLNCILAETLEFFLKKEVETECAMEKDGGKQQHSLKWAERFRHSR